jgi:hypothetical protein
MCVLCYTMGSGIGEAALFGGPFAFTVVRKVKARLGFAPDDVEPEPAPDPEASAEPARGPAAPAARAPSPAPA